MLAHAQQYLQNRRFSERLFSFVAPEAYYDAPIPLRHPFVFYHGHLPAFSFLTLNRRILRESPIDSTLERLFRRGIDPDTVKHARASAVEQWPSRRSIDQFIEACDERVLRALHENGSSNWLAAGTIIEHEAMHHETLTYIIHQLAHELKQGPRFEHRDGAVPLSEPLSIAAGIAVLGCSPTPERFTWDNESGRNEQFVPAFAIDRFKVTNARWFSFVEAGGPIPPFWSRRDGNWELRCCFENIQLPWSWPVYVTQEQAAAYATWIGAQLPTEAQFHRAAFTTPWSEPREFPWGNELPDARHGNFGFRRFDPEPVDATPDGQSAWGIHGAVGNGWEWTQTQFSPFPEFDPLPTYPEYSADFFDGRHYVLKGASPATPTRLLRSTFRNWFYSDYPYAYAAFRCAWR